MQENTETHCTICNSSSYRIFTKKVLNRDFVNYFQCKSCSFLFTEKPYWLNEAYSNAITKLDIGLIYRNLYLSPIVEKIVHNQFNCKGKFLDYGGGYGMLVRMMRDKGLNFYRYDMYCENLFAENFDLIDLVPDTQFELLTAFEVFEHLPNPLEEISTMFRYTDTILFSTELQPKQGLEDWWYIAPETGQHISFYSKKCLKKIADLFNASFFSNGYDLHLITKRHEIKNPFHTKKTWKTRYNNMISKLLLKENSPKQESLLMKDYELIKQKLNKIQETGNNHPNENFI